MIVFSSDAIADVTVRLDATPALPKGYGGWEVVSRPRRKGLTQYVGKDPIRMSVAVLFDGFKSGQGQEIPISRMTRMALPPSAGAEPPQIKVSGPGLPNTGVVDWVIEDLTWGQNVIYENVGGVTVRTRQDCVVSLLEYVDPTREAFKSLPGLSVVSGKKKVPTRVTIKAGMTLQQLAARYYGDASKWKKIAEANNIRDPKHLPKTVRLP